MHILNSPDYWLLTPYSSPNRRLLIFARDLLFTEKAPHTRYSRAEFLIEQRHTDAFNQIKSLLTKAPIFCHLIDEKADKYLWSRLSMHLPWFLGQCDRYRKQPYLCCIAQGSERSRGIQETEHDQKETSEESGDDGQATQEEPRGWVFVKEVHRGIYVKFFSHMFILQIIWYVSWSRNYMSQ